VLCSGSAQFVMRHDKRKLYRLLAAQTPLGRALYAHYGLDAQDYETMILIADGVAMLRSEAVIRIAQGLGLPWSLAAAARIMPRSWRDYLYGVLARNRLRIMGRRKTCFMPSPADADRFLA
jgi:predicted DCC family thiol-disulfide oxidoreductase YuxK